MDSDKILTEHTTSKVVELVDHVNSALFWMLDYMKKNHISVDASMAFHIRRLKVILDELSSPLLSKY